ncbi:MAG: hypothetical protein WDA09_06435 [Bacteriovoracaceae bacterium]
MSQSDLDKYFEIAISEESLKKASKREELREKFHSIKTGNKDLLIDFEEALVDAFDSLDKYKVYHVALFDDVQLENVLNDITKSLDRSKVQIFEKPYVNKGLYKLNPSHADSKYALGILTFKDKIRSIRDESGVIISEERFKILYMYRIDIMEVYTGKKILIISLPTYSERKGSTFYFNEEIQYVYDLFEGFGLQLKPFPLKDFFNDIPHDNDLKTKGFHGRSVDGLNGVGELPIEVKYKREVISLEEYQEFFRTIDDSIYGDLVPLIIAKLKSVGINDGRIAPIISSELGSYGLAEAVVEEMKIYSRDGAGWLFYRDETSTAVHNYTLIYNKVNKLQFRCTLESWDIFRPLYDEIKRYISKI